MSEFANTMRAMQGAIEGAQQELTKPATVDMVQRFAAAHIRSEDTVKATLHAVNVVLENLRTTYEAEAARYRSKDLQSCRCHETTGHEDIRQTRQSFIPGMGGCPVHTGPHYRSMVSGEALDEPDDCNRCGFPHSGACNPDA